MKQYILNLTKEKTSDNNPSTNTDLANSLELLSSGIYTEEERFVFELLQNAVDAHSGDTDESLEIKIVFQNDYMIFMHNGEPFSKRDVEGICSVGNGNKSKDIKKIGYKGIGFKSVFMHSDLVYIKSEDVIFRFEKAHWTNFYDVRTSETGREFKMPWQIIPIYTECLPIDIDTNGYNVCTIIKTSETTSLYSKLISLLSTCQFLLFLRNKNVSIKLYQDGEYVKSIKKSSVDTISIDDSTYQSEVSLYIDDTLQSRWLIYKNDSILVPEDIKRIIRKDPKTPQKLQDTETYDISFAIALNAEDKFESVKESILYTYLPTSCKFGLPFLVNANFLTDAGRQQLVADSEWNKMVIGSIPELYLSWIATLSSSHSEYVDILPSLKNGYKVLGGVFESSLKQALETMAFIPSMNDGKVKLKVSDSIIDTISLHKGLTTIRFNNFIKANLNSSLSVANIISNKRLSILEEYGAHVITSKSLSSLLENTSKYLSKWTDEECLSFCKWIQEQFFYADKKFVNFLGASPFLLDENNKLASPNELFFPSNYREDNDIADTAKVLSPTLFELLQANGLEIWLQEIGVQEMSHLSVIENVLCKDGFITKENAIEVLQFIFDVNKNEDIFDGISNYLRRNIKVLTTKGSLREASQLYLTQDYKANIGLEDNAPVDCLVSSK